MVKVVAVQPPRCGGTKGASPPRTPPCPRASRSELLLCPPFIWLCFCKLMQHNDYVSLLYLTKINIVSCCCSVSGIKNLCATCVFRRLYSVPLVIQCSVGYTVFRRLYSVPSVIQPLSNWKQYLPLNIQYSLNCSTDTIPSTNCCLCLCLSDNQSKDNRMPIIFLECCIWMALMSISIAQPHCDLVYSLSQNNHQ
jgi:hypothetical protein